MVWLHLKLLAARDSFVQVIGGGRARAARASTSRSAASEARLRRGDADDELRRSLEQQLEVIRSRRAAHADAARRRELVDAELERLRQQISLVREQALLATDEQSVAASLDAVSASLNEANRWLKRPARDLRGARRARPTRRRRPELLRPKSRAGRRQRCRSDRRPSEPEEDVHEPAIDAAAASAAPPRQPAHRCCSSSG